MLRPIRSSEPASDEFDEAVRRWTAFQDAFKSDRSGQSCRISKFHALNHMPGWRNWQTHRT